MVFMTIVQLSLGGLLLPAGAAKLLGISGATTMVTRHGYPMWMARVVGALEVAGAIGLVAGWWQPLLAIAGSVLIVAVMLSAIHAHLVRSGEPLVRAIPALLVLTLAAATLIWNAPNLGALRSSGGGRASVDRLAETVQRNGVAPRVSFVPIGAQHRPRGGPRKDPCSSPRTGFAPTARYASMMGSSRDRMCKVRKHGISVSDLRKADRPRELMRLTPLIVARPGCVDRREKG